MLGKLDDALKTLLADSLPTLFGGGTPAVKMTVSSQQFDFDPRSLDAVPGEPRPDDRTDNLPFDAAHPEGPYLLSQVPDPDVRRLWLITAQNDLITLTKDEVLWDKVEPRRFTLHLRAGRDPASVANVRVLYSVPAIFTQIKYRETVALALQGDAAKLGQAEALAVGVIALNMKQLATAAAQSFSDGAYAAQVTAVSLHLTGGTSPAADQRVLNFLGEFELKVNRALGAGEGVPIQRIRTVSQPVSDRKVDIRINVEA
jgi:hypothetical protein